MTVTVVKAGMLSTLQAGPRSGRRHLGIPGGGAADPLSLALANRLLGNAWDTPAIEATLTGPVLRFDADASVAVAGAAVSVTRNGREEGCHRSFVAKAGDELAIGAAETGARAYVAVGGGFSADDALGSTSTDLQAGFGGYRGRALKTGDELAVGGVTGSDITTPAEFQPNLSNAWAVRVCEAAETGWLENASREALFATNWVVDRRADRMGLRLDGPTLTVSSDGRMPSAGVVPGTIQCPEDGAPYVLSVDAGTVGGYPRVAQVARVDRHVLGQLRPGDHVRLLERAPDQAVAELREKIACWEPWLPDIAEIL
jgi:biotin-dependent carboxylase-like uncharacterized protein